MAIVSRKLTFFSTILNCRNIKRLWKYHDACATTPLGWGGGQKNGYEDWTTNNSCILSILDMCGGIFLVRNAPYNT